MTYKVSVTGAEGLTLSESDTVKSVLQNISIILRTRRGSVPHYREFGLPMGFLDRPITAARPLVFAEVKEAVERFERRAEVVRVDVRADITGRVTPVVEVKIRGEQGN